MSMKTSKFLRIKEGRGNTEERRKTGVGRRKRHKQEEREGADTEERRKTGVGRRKRHKQEEREGAEWYYFFLYFLFTIY